MPIAVVPVEAETTAVIAASREAKAVGVRMGMRIFDARRVCPKLVLVKARPREYVRIHEELLRCVDACAPVCKVYSIDEWSVQLVGDERSPKGAERLARAIKDRMCLDFGPALTCSIGVAPSRLLAKIASDLKKPDGLTMLTRADMPSAVAHLKLQDLCGIGPGNERRLEAAGVTDPTVLWNLSRREADRIWVMDRGIPTEEVLEEMRRADPPVRYLVGTPKGRLSKLEESFAAKPWEQVREQVDVKLLRIGPSEDSEFLAADAGKSGGEKAGDAELYILARSQGRVNKERAMRRRALKRLWKRLGEIKAMKRLTREECLMKLGSARKEAGRVQVKFGRSSVSFIEVLEGLQLGDQIILSDMSQWDSHDRLRLN